MLSQTLKNATKTGVASADGSAEATAQCPLKGHAVLRVNMHFLTTRLLRQYAFFCDPWPLPKSATTKNLSFLAHRNVVGLGRVEVAFKCNNTQLAKFLSHLQKHGFKIKLQLISGGTIATESFEEK